MPVELPKQYDPHEAQSKWLAFWEQRGYFHVEPDESRKPFCIVIPPPNVTGALHMGHALNNTLQDVLIRWRRMQGYDALWVPGTDHAGIATQAVVERRVMDEQGKTRRDLGREELVRRIWEWKDQYESRILGQLRQLGCSCDWQRTHFTLDAQCARAVRQTFFDLFKEGLIYRGKRLVNWDTSLQTAVADDEIFHEEVQGGFWTFRYPVKGSTEFIRFSTTRPETMIGDTAVAVHPDDSRYKHLIGKTVTVPLVGREIPIIADEQLVDPTLGTGAVKVTPAHDPNDYASGQRHGLPMINILNPDGSINANGGPYAGLERLIARERVVADMEKLGLFEGREDRLIDLAHSDRSKTPIEPYLSDQWFVRMGDLAQRAIAVVAQGKIKFTPARYAKTYTDWLGEKRDWCISRQLWWGHRIPVWRKCVTVEQALAKQPLFGFLELPGTESEATPQKLRKEYQEFCADQWLSLEDQNGHTIAVELLIAVAPGQGDFERELELAGFEQDPDVLDTWFSSALWPHSTLGWPEKTADLAYYYPTSVLCTSRDIITLWVARMVVMGLHNTREVPFHEVYIHPKILDGFGETMSKSKGNGVDPLDIIARYGTDALRFVMAHLATEKQDSRLPVANVCPHCDALVPVKREHMSMRTRKIACPNCKKPFRPGGPWPSEDPELPTAKQASERFELGRNFANKLWNAARFLLLNLDGYTSGPVSLGELPVEDRWILSRLATATETVTNHLEAYEFSDAARTLYDFIWSEFCDWYVEMSKERLREPGERAAVQRVLVGVLDAIVRLVHPIMPFVAESLWQALAEAAPERGLPTASPASESVVIAAWPSFPSEFRDAEMERRMARMQDLVRAVREARNRYNLDPRDKLDVLVRCDSGTASDLNALAPFILRLAGVGKLECGPEIAKPRQATQYVHPDFQAFVSLEGKIDVAAEIQRIEKQLGEKRKHLAQTEAQLANSNFVNKAPAEKVEQQRQLAEDVRAQIEALDANLRDLKAG